MKKIVWAEGVLLGQQHLQQFDRYHHERQDFLARLASPYPWGIKKLCWCEDSIPFGKLTIDKLECVLPHGQVIKYDKRFDKPLSIELNPTTEICESIYLAMPLSEHIKDITGYPSQSSLSGWSGVYECILDTQDNEREREVLVAHPNVYLLTSREDRSAFYSIKIAELVKKNNGEWMFDTQFIPACLSLDISDALVKFVQTYTELLTSKINLLQSRQKQGRLEWRDFFLLQLFSTFLSELQFALSCPHTHPIALYKIIIRLAGALLPEGPLPLYDHHNLTDVFELLDKIVKRSIDQAIPSRTASVQWHRESPYLYTTSVIEPGIFDKNNKKSFYLAVSMDTPVLDWLEPFSREVKLGARSVIESIVASALQGVQLIHIQRPPAQLSIRAGYEYFYVEPKESFWEQVKAEQTLALFVSQRFSSAQIELLTVDEGALS